MNILIQIILGLIAADILTGMFHWIEDRYFSYNSSNWIIRMIARDNHMHHYFPRATLASSYAETCMIPIIIVTIIMLLFIAMFPNLFYEYFYFFITLYIGASVANLFHYWSHQRKCETIPIIGFLQESGLLCNHSYHSIHHINSTEKYCVIFRFNNYLLDSINFWSWLEYIVEIIGSIKPSNTNLGYNEFNEIKTKLHYDAENKVCPDVITSEELAKLTNILYNYYNEPKN